MIKGDRVYLRAINVDDIDSIARCFQNEEIMYMTGTRNVLTKEQIKEAIKRFSEDSSRYDFAICLTDNDQVIGDLAIMEVDVDNRKAMFRIALHSIVECGRGYGSEAVQLAQKFTFEELNLNRLELQVYSHNSRAIKSYEKVGFKKEGVLRQALFMNNTFSDEIIMSMLCEEYMNKNSKGPI
ncbi:GNAT family N-acetyltransferase [Lysinibacillus cavernae]|uniref:GNAT family N-acetyltransferase n=1 Tax=Lysinibacillus cavernae TaxID=2666135 RepID=UPI0012D8B34F|nr:GNAT family protein [Lysinibacillus cavernae]